MKKITIYTNNEETQVYLTPCGKAFTICGSGGVREVLENVQVEDVSLSVEAKLIETHIEKTSQK